MHTAPFTWGLAPGSEIYTCLIQFGAFLTMLVTMKAIPVADVSSFRTQCFALLVPAGTGGPTVHRSLIDVAYSLHFLCRFSHSLRRESGSDVGLFVAFLQFLDSLPCQFVRQYPCRTRYGRQLRLLLHLADMCGFSP
jgi:hypothetical protein